MSLLTPGTHRIEITDLGYNETGSYLVSMCCGAASEVCNGVDDNCNGQIDEGAKSTFYQDADGDGYGSPAATTQACVQPSGYVIDNHDCNDSSSGIHPGATETCGDGIDQNCDGIDPTCPPPAPLAILSPNGGEVWPTTVRIDRVRKMPVYAREHVGHLWLIDPLMRTLEVYRLEGQRWVVASTHGSNEAVHAEPCEVLGLDMSRWWLEPSPE